MKINWQVEETHTMAGLINHDLENEI